MGAARPIPTSIARADGRRGCAAHRSRVCERTGRTVRDRLPNPEGQRAGSPGATLPGLDCRRAGTVPRCTGAGQRRRPACVGQSAWVPPLEQSSLAPWLREAIGRGWRFCLPSSPLCPSGVPGEGGGGTRGASGPVSG